MVARPQVTQNLQRATIVNAHLFAVCRKQSRIPVSLQPSVPALFKATDVRQVPRHYRLVAGGVRIVEYPNGLVIILVINVVRKGHDPVRCARPKHQVPTAETAFAIPFDRRSTIERHTEVSPTSRKPTTIIFPANHPSIVSDVQAQSATGLKDCSLIVVIGVICLQINATRSKVRAVCSHIQRTAADILATRKSAIAATQDQCARPLLVQGISTRQITRECAEMIEAVGSNLGVAIDLNIVRQRDIVRIKGRAKAEPLIVEAVVVAVPINPVASVSGGQRNRQRSTEAREPTPTIEADLTETSAVHAIADFSGKGAAGAEDTILEANHRSVRQTHPLLGDQHRGVVHLGFTGVEVGSRQIDVAVGVVIIHATLMGFQAFTSALFHDVEGRSRPAQPDSIPNPHTVCGQLAVPFTIPNLKEINVQRPGTRNLQLGVVVDMNVLIIGR